MHEKYERKFSQSDEDIYLEKVFKKLELPIDWCCEFGAWDGLAFSNTFYFVKNYKTNSVYIEGDAVKYNDLLLTAKDFSNIIPINAFVNRSSSSNDSLDNLLSKTKIPIDFDILSIDIDSHDADVWLSLSKYQPKCVIIEINNEISPGVKQKHSDMTEEQIQKRGIYWLNSFTTTVEVGRSKGYIPIKHIGWNLVFIKEQYADMLGVNIKESYDYLFNYRWVDRRKRRLAKAEKKQRKMNG